MSSSLPSQDVVRRSVHVPLIGNRWVRGLLGLALLVASISYTACTHGCEGLSTLLAIAVLAWLPAVLLTDKYVHKYPQRYYSYLLACHLKADLVMGILLLLLGVLAGLDQLWPVAASGFVTFIVADLVFSTPRRFRQAKERCAAQHSGPAGGTSGAAQGQDLLPVDTAAILAKLGALVDRDLAEFIERELPQGEGTSSEVVVCTPDSIDSQALQAGTAALVVNSVRMNDVRRINRFLLRCAATLGMGGYFVCRYTPYEASLKKLRECYPAPLYRLAYLLHFAMYRALPKIPYLNALYFSLTRGKGRVFSKVELWGRLSYCGMHVVAEAGNETEKVLIAQKSALPSSNRRPSYYPVVALEKVGLDGDVLRLHKVRSMYPFSEFLQKRIFEDNGLAATGKFANDFRLTEYGNFIRKYWIDELPQIFDWLRGDIKLVGMRATSRHYLGLYPQELYDLYIQVKPGLVPPIFDEKTDSFEKIVEIEMGYLTSYMQSPWRTDVGLFVKTFTDIFFRGVRSK